MKTHLLFLCLVGCICILLVVGHPIDQRRDSEKILPETKKTLDRLVGGAAAVVIVIGIVCCVIFCIRRNERETERHDDEPTPRPPPEQVRPPPRSSSPMSNAAGEGDDHDKCFRSFLMQHPEYQDQGQKWMDLGSRMQEHWYRVETKDDVREKKMLTILPVSHQCPLKLHKHQRGLNKLLRVLKEHPYLHSIELVEYLPHHELLVMVQPLMEEGSLKDMIYKSAPLTKWSDKYTRRSSGLPPDKVAHYGRQILEAMKFLYSKGFPTLGHIQSGNIFIVDDVCHLGGYENTLLGYKTRLFRLCKDHLQHFDVILFGHLVFEMAAGYQLTHLRPSEKEYEKMDEKVKSILKYIFEEGFPHDINAVSRLMTSLVIVVMVTSLLRISAHEFFDDSLSELNNFDPNQIQLSKSMNKVLEKVRKGKIRVQKSTKLREAKPNDGASGSSLTTKVKTTLSGLKLKGKSSSKNVGAGDTTPLLAKRNIN